MDQRSTEGSQRFYDTGSYHIVVTTPQRYWQSAWSDTLYRDFAVAGWVVFADNTADGSAGLALRSQSAAADGYQFLLFPQGHFIFRKNRGNAPTILAEGDAASLLQPNLASNELGAIAVGDRFTLYVNGQWVATVSDDTYREGYAGLVAVAQQTPVHAVFRDVSIFTWPADIATESSSPGTIIGGILLVLFITVLTNYNRILDLLLPSSVTTIKLGPLTIPLNRTGAPYMPLAGDFASRAGSVYAPVGGDLVEPPQPDAEEGTQDPAGAHSWAHPTGRTSLPLKPAWPLLEQKTAITPAPLHRNPYIVGPPVEDRALFFGREDVFDYVRSGLATRSGNVTLVLYGGRRTGKTSVLRQIRTGRLGSAFAPVYVDMQVMAEVDTHEFFGKIGRTVSQALPEAPLQLSLDALADRNQNAYSLFETLLVQATEASGKRTLLLMFDEYEILERLVDGGRLSADIFPYLKSLMEQPRRLAFLFTGSRPLEEMRGQYWDWARTFSPARYKRISFLSDDAARRLIVEPVKSFLTYEDAALAAVLRLSAGHPYFTQGLCSTIVDAALQESQPTVSLAAVQEAVADLVENPLPHMIYLWNEANHAERLVLAGLAAFLTDSDAWLRPDDVTAQLEAHHSGLTPDQVRTALAGLVRQELLERQDDRFRYRIDFLRHWIAQDHSLWQTLAEH